MTRLATIPPIEELAPHRWDRECYEVAAGIAQQHPHLKEDAGFYVHPEKGIGDHGWNIAPDGTIVDMTATQHGYDGEQDEQDEDYHFPAPQYPEIIPPGHPHYDRYVSWERHPEQSQVVAHDKGYHQGHNDNVGVCPKCPGFEKQALDYAGDGLPAQEPQALTDAEAGNNTPWADKAGVQDYNFVFANGQLHLSDQHEHEDLLGHAGIRGDHAGPMAMGHVHVDMGKATFEIEANLSAQAIARVLKDYCKTQGWRWGGMTDLQGEPVDTGSEFAPVSSFYILAGRNPDTVRIAKRVNSATNSDLILAVHVDDREAKAYLDRPMPVQYWDGVKEWADDHGLTLVAGNDNVLKKIEDLEENNVYSPEWNNEQDHHLFQSPPDERQPGGVFKCPTCSQLFPSFSTYLLHRRAEEPMGDNDATPDSGFPELNDDATFPPNTSEPLKFYEGAALPPGMGEAADLYFNQAFNMAQRDAQSLGHERSVQIAYETLLRALQTNRDIRLPPEQAKEIADHWRNSYMKMFIGEERSLGVPNDPRWSNFRASAPKSPSPKDLLAAPIPFLYDIQEDKIFVGQPGQRHSDIPGKFTPGGMVEGTYEPGGKVFIRSMTNMPYTVRHMLELWYYQHPEMEIKGIQLEDDEGKRTKLAAGQDIGGYINAIVASDPTVWTASRALMQAGGHVYVVGGAVRDAILGKEPKDIDLMVTGLPADKVRNVLNSLPGKVDLTGKDFGVFRYNHGGSEVEIALPRRERSTGAGHQDFDVQADHTMTPEEDLYRRDFTANAMAVDLSNGQLLDPFHGSDDLQTHTLRTLNTKSLSDDPLRTVRALVATSKHGLIPDRETQNQMGDNAHLIQALPAERIQAELDKLFAGKNPGRAIQLAAETGVLDHVFPEVARAVGHSQNNPHHELELFEHLVNVLDRAKERKPDDPDFALAALMHDTGKVDSHWTECRDCGWKGHGHHLPCPECGSANTSGHFYALEPGIGKNHEDVGADIVDERLRALKYPAKRIERVRDLVQHHMYPHFTSPKGARKFLQKVGPHAEDLLDLRWADQGGKSTYPTDPSASIDQERNLLYQVRQAQEPTSLAQLAINGRDLINAGVPQGPQIGQILRDLTDVVVDDPTLNHGDALLQLVRERYGYGN